MNNLAATIEKFVSDTIAAQTATSVAAASKDIRDVMDVIKAEIVDAAKDAEDQLVADTAQIIDDTVDVVSALQADNDDSKSSLESLKDLEAVGPAITKVVAALSTTHYMDSSVPVLRHCYFHTHQHRSSWLVGNQGDLFGGVNPSAWTDSNGMG